MMKYNRIIEYELIQRGFDDSLHVGVNHEYSSEGPYWNNCDFYGDDDWDDQPCEKCSKLLFSCVTDESCYEWLHEKASEYIFGCACPNDYILKINGIYWGTICENDKEDFIEALQLEPKN